MYCSTYCYKEEMSDGVKEGENSYRNTARTLLAKTNCLDNLNVHSSRYIQSILLSKSVLLPRVFQKGLDCK